MKKPREIKLSSSEDSNGQTAERQDIAPNENVIVFSEDELSALRGSQPKGRTISGGGVLTVRIFLEVEGLGSFRAGPLNTAAGNDSGWVGAGVTLTLIATPAPGWQFTHWLFNGLFGGTSPKHFIAARIGLKIKAVFKEVGKSK